MMFVDNCALGVAGVHLASTLLLIPNSYLPLAYFYCVGWHGFYYSLLASIFSSIIVYYFFDVLAVFLNRFSFFSGFLNRVSFFKVKALALYERFGSGAGIIFGLNLFAVFVFSPVFLQVLIVKLMVRSFFVFLIVVFFAQLISNLLAFYIVDSGWVLYGYFDNYFILQ